MSERRYVRVLWIVGLVALAARVLAAIALDGLRHPHLEEYDGIARNILAGRGFTFVHHGVLYRSYIAPLPAWFAAASYWLAGSLAPAMLLQIAAGTLLAVVTSIVSRRLFGGWVAPLAAGLLVAVHPGLTVYAASRSHSLAYDSLFFMLVLLLSFRLAERPHPARAAQLGLVVGIGALSRATIVVFLPIAAIWLFAVSAHALRGAAMRGIVVAALCAAAVVAPWTIRNWYVHGQFVFVLTTDSEVFWRGNNPLATGNSYVDSMHSIYDVLPADVNRDLERQPGELAQAAWFRNRAGEFIRANPGAFARLTVSKFLQFWSFSPHTGVLYPRAWLQLYLVYYAVALSLAALGLWQLFAAGGRERPRALLLCAFLVALSALQSLYYVEGRHRWAVEPMLLALGGGGAAALHRRLNSEAAGLPFQST